MVYSRIFCLSLFLGLLACTEKAPLAPAYSKAEADSLIKIKYEEFFETHQGTPRAMTLLDEIIELDSTNAEAWREKSIPYLKRGYPHEWFENYQIAVKYGATEWIGWRGYCYLFFYRDFERAIADFDALDTLTPDFTDHPQAMSTHLLRGISYYGLKNFEKSLEYFQKYIDEELAGTGGFDFIDQNAFLYRGRAYQEMGNHALALKEFETGLRIFNQSSDLYYHMTRSHIEMENTSLAKSTAIKAKEYFELGYFHHRPYIEVLDQRYDYDIKELMEKLKLN